MFDAYKPDDFPPKAEIVLNIYSEETHYYCVDHDRRFIFFLSAFKLEWMPSWQQVVGAFSKNHLREWFNHETDSHY